MYPFGVPAIDTLAPPKLAAAEGSGVQLDPSGECQIRVARLSRSRAKAIRPPGPEATSRPGSYQSPNIAGSSETRVQARPSADRHRRIPGALSGLPGLPMAMSPPGTDATRSMIESSNVPP